MFWPQYTFKIAPGLKNYDILMFASHNKLHMYGFSDMVSLLGNAPGTLHLWCGSW